MAQDEPGGFRHRRQRSPGVAPIMTEPRIYFTVKKLKGRHHQYHSTARRENLPHIAQHIFLFLDMFQHIEAGNGIDSMAFEVS